MDYEQKYKESLERAKKNYITAQDLCEGAQIGVECFKNTLESIFPELKDEDERIRKEIISALKFANFKGVYDKHITWLEKQGEQKVSAVEFNAKDWYVSKVDGKIYNAKFMEKPHTNKTRKLEIEKAAMSATGIIEQEEWFIKGAEWADENPSYISSEKQGEQKAQAKSAIEAWKDMRLEVYQQASGNRHEVNYSDDTTKMFSLNDIDEIIEKISEQKLADKTEPKFHEGDWITDDYNIFYVDKIKDDKYFGTYLTDEFDETIDGKIAFKSEKYYHHLTIKDLIKRYGRKL